MKLLHKIFTCVLAAAAFAPAADAQVIAPSDTLSTAVGTVLGNYIRGSLDQLVTLGVPVDNDVFIATLAQVVKGQPTGLSAEEADKWIDRYISATRPGDLPDSFTPESQQAFLDSVASLPGAVRRPSGLVFIEEKPGSGDKPTADDTVEVKYTLRFSDGTVADATGRPVRFKVNELTPGFSEGLLLMQPGGRYRIAMPASLGYGPEGITGAVPGNAALDFTVELIDVIK
ncbi:MAG: FKBP-type peptidyl-prolyl cis-trans isomerase [Muribaculaceae bacterium]|nr:FKBP-type peptidyl-prolyl cis-trans isomerase [Muribaculaceae bacterium]